MTHKKVLYDPQHECTMNIMQGGSRFWFFRECWAGVELRIPTGRCGLATSPRWDVLIHVKFTYCQYLSVMYNEP